MAQCPYQSFEPVEACIQRDVDYCEFNDEDEMVTTERELAEDAQWKKIQQNTFTRWANEHLKTVEKHIANLETDLSDGLRLITLIEVLAGKRLPKHNKKPSFRSQKLENVSVALKFLQDDEGIRIVNIGEWIGPALLSLGAFSRIPATLQTTYHSFRLFAFAAVRSPNFFRSKPQQEAHYRKPDI